MASGSNWLALQSSVLHAGLTLGADLGALGRLHIDRPINDNHPLLWVWFGLPWEPVFYLAGPSGHGPHEVWLTYFKATVLGAETQYPKSTHLEETPGANDVGDKDERLFPRNDMAGEREGSLGSVSQCMLLASGSVLLPSSCEESTRALPSNYC